MQYIHNINYFENGEWEAFPLKEAGDQLDQIVKGAAGKVGQLPELVPEAELESHLWERREGLKEQLNPETHISYSIV